ncbi:MAG: transposase family protein [Eubacteriales bacterium]|nr:transposase family protein [Eubacteriales bacterium]
MKDIIVIVLFDTLANVDDRVEMEYFAHYHEEYLKKYIELKNGIPSYDTLGRVFEMLTSEVL